MALVRDEQAIIFELRTVWAKQLPVVLILTKRCQIRRIEGKVERVAATGAYVIVAGWHVPREDILNVLRPHYTQKGKP